MWEAHIRGTLHLMYVFVPFWIYMASTNLSDAVIGSLLFIIPLCLFICLVGLISLPYGFAMEHLMRKANCNSWPEYLFAGITSGVLMAILTQWFMVDTAPESTDYQEIYGPERAMLFLRHYAMGAVAGVIYSLNYKRARS